MAGHQARLLQVVGVVVYAHTEQAARSEVADFKVAGLAVATAQLQLADNRVVLQEILLADAPGNGSRRERAVAVVRAEARGTVAAYAGGENVLATEVIVEAGKARYQRPHAGVRRSIGFYRAGRERTNGVAGEVRRQGLNPFLHRFLHRSTHQDVHVVVLVEGFGVVGSGFVQPVRDAAVVGAGLAVGGNGLQQHVGQELVFFEREVVGTEAGANAQVLYGLYFGKHVADEAAVAGLQRGLEGGRYRVFNRRERVAAVGAVCVVNGRLRTQQYGCAQHPVDVVVVGNPAAERTAQRQVGAHFHAVGDVVLEVEAATATLEARTDDDAVLVEERARQQKFGFGIAA